MAIKWDDPRGTVRPAHSQMNWRPSVGPCRPTLCTSPPYCGMSEKLTSWTASGDLLALWPLVGFVHWRGQQKTRGQVRAFVPGHPPCQATVGGLCEGPQLLSSGPLWTHPHSFIIVGLEKAKCRNWQKIVSLVGISICPNGNTSFGMKTTSTSNRCHT